MQSKIKQEKEFKLFIQYWQRKNMTKDGNEWKERITDRLFRDRKATTTRFDVYETLCPQQMLVYKGGQIKNWSGECRDIIPTKLQCQTIQRALQSPNLQREII